MSNELVVLNENAVSTRPYQKFLPGEWAVPTRKADFLASVRAHLKLAFLIVGTTLLAGLVVALVMGGRTYLAEAAIRITPTYTVPIQETYQVRFDTGVEYRSFVEQQLRDIDSFATVSQALRSLGANRSLWQKPGETEERAVRRLMWRLKVGSASNTYLVTVGLQGSKPAGLAETVNAIVQAYLMRHENDDEAGNDGRIKVLTTNKARIEAQVAEENLRLNGLAQEIGAFSFGYNFSDPYEKRLLEANQALDHARREFVSAKAHLEAARAHLDRERSLEVDSAAERMLVDDKGGSDATKQLIARREAVFLELRGLSPNHPGREALQQEVADINDEINRDKEERLKGLRAMLRTSGETTAQKELFKAQARVDEAQRAQDGLEKQVEALRASVSWFSGKYSVATALHQDIERNRKEVEAIDSRIGSLKTEIQAPGSVRVDSPARTPDLPESGTRRKILAMFALLAAVLGVGVPTAMELKEPGVKNAEELEAILGFPPLGSIPGVGSAKQAGWTPEVLRRIALGILRERRASNTRVFVLTGVREQAGTTSLALALAQELTTLGARTIPIEANALSPDPRYRKACSSSSNGTCVAAMNGAARFSPPPHRRTRPLTLLPPPPDNPVIDLDTLAQPIAVCRHKTERRIQFQCAQSQIESGLALNDIVLLDTPPLLDCPDTEMLIQMPAGALLIVRLGRDRAREVMAAGRLLERLSASAVGTIISQVPDGGRPVVTAVNGREHVNGRIRGDTGGKEAPREELGVARA